MLFEHILLLLKMCFFHSKGPERQNQIVCWARSPGDHAMHITQFPIKNFNWFGEEIDPKNPNEDDMPKRDFDDVIEELIQFEEDMIKVRIKFMFFLKSTKLKDVEDEEESEDKLEQLNANAIELEDDIKLLAHNVQELIRS